VCEQLASSGVRVIAAGLDMDFQGRPFGPMPQLMAMAEYVTKVHAICMHCGDLATFSHRTTASQDLVLLGETDSYEPLVPHLFRWPNAIAAPATNTMSFARPPCRCSPRSQTAH
jgi:thymidine kinase